MGSDLGSPAITSQILSSRHARAALVALSACATILYLIGVPGNPPGFHIDESSIAYNAYTISRSGCDEFGNSWPLYFRAFDDYKNPVHVYLLGAFFKLTGPSISVARLLSAIAGVAAGLTLGVLAARMARNVTVGLLTAIAALLTPWFFEVSRIALEVALYPLVLGLFLLCVHHVSGKPRWSRLDIAAIALTLALVTYTYSIGRLLGPLLSLGLAFFFTTQRWRSVVRTWFAYGLTLIPLVVFSDKTPGALTLRFKATTYLSPDLGTGETVLRFLQQYARNLNVWRWLVTGDPNRDQVAHIFGTGHFLAGVFVFALFGIWVILRRELAQPWWRFVAYGFVVSVIPASLTKDPVHMLRLIPMPLFLLIFAAVGIGWFVQNATAAPARAVFVGLLAASLAQAAAFQSTFHRSEPAARRTRLFDAHYREKIFAPAIASTQRPIYIADVPNSPGYIQAYWYGTLAGVDLSTFVRLRGDESPPAGALVISTEKHCPGCNVIAKLKPYTLHVANSPAPNATR